MNAAQKYTPPGSVISWLKEKRHFLLIGSQHEDYAPWKDLFRDIAVQSTTFRRAVCPRLKFYILPWDRSTPKIPTPFGVILVPDYNYGQRIVTHLFNIAKHGIILDGLKVNVPRLQDDVFISTPSGLAELVGANKINCSKIQIVLLCMVDHLLEEKIIPEISNILPPKSNRSTILYSNRLRQNSRHAMRVLLHPHADMIWLPELIGSARMEAKTILLQDYIKDKCQRNGRHDRIMILCRTKKEADFVCGKVKAVDGRPGTSYPSQLTSITARQEKLHSFRSFLNPILFVSVKDLKQFDPDCVDAVINFNAEADVWITRQNSRGRVFCK